jgi:DNA-binding MarR family transcriptional regulator
VCFGRPCWPDVQFFFFPEAFPVDLFCLLPMNGDFADIEYLILENIYASARQIPPLRQRDLAQLAKTSLGMTNAILKRLAQKGWITIKRLNSRNIHYAVTLEGFNEIIHRSYGYFKRTIKNVFFYKDAIDEIVRNAAGKKMKAVLLIGTSDLEFIVEHSCYHHGLSFLKSADQSIVTDRIDRQTIMIFAENIPVSPKLPEKNTYFLSHLLIKVAAAS